VTRPFEDFERALARYPASFRARVDAYGDATAGEWRLLALECRDRVERANDFDPLLDYVPRTRRPGPAATPTRPGAVALSTGDDPLKAIPPATYFEALAEVVVPANGWVSCPNPDHEDRTPSCQVLSTHWRCFGCGRGGGVIDLAAAVWQIEPRGSGYLEIRRRLVAEFGLARSSS
jgi:CHC2 zinc finger